MESKLAIGLGAAFGVFVLVYAVKLVRDTSQSFEDARRPREPWDV